MKKFWLEFWKRGAVSAAGGPLILAVICGILGANGVVESLSPGEVCMGIISTCLMAFIAAGISAIYQTERLPLISAALIHAGVLYCDYLLMYLLNSWIPRDLAAIGFFTAIFAVGYALIWLCIWLIIRRSTQKLNRSLQNRE